MGVSGSGGTNSEKSERSEGVGAFDIIFQFNDLKVYLLNLCHFFTIFSDFSDLGGKAPPSPPWCSHWRFAANFRIGMCRPQFKNGAFG